LNEVVVVDGVVVIALKGTVVEISKMHVREQEWLEARTSQPHMLLRHEHI
jgi:hypothetical protein